MARGYLRGVPTIVPSVRSVPSASFDPRLKTTSRMTNNLADLEVSALDPDAHALLLDTQGFVSEGTGANFFAVVADELLTPHESDVLDGISRRTAIELARASGIPCRAARMTMFDIRNASEAFFTGTSFCLLPVHSVNGVALGKHVPGPITRQLLQAWANLIGHDFVAQAVSHLSADERSDEKLVGGMRRVIR